MDESVVVDEIVAEFLVEAHEALDQLERDLGELELRPSAEIIGSVFRAVHSIKGTCGFFGFGHLETLTHVAESVLVRLRDGTLKATPEVTRALTSVVDVARGMLEAIEATGEEAEPAPATLIDELNRLLAVEAPAPVPRLGDMLIERGLVTSEDIELVIARQGLGDDRPMGAILVDLGMVTAADIESVLSAQSERRGVPMAESTIRVDVGLLDEVMELVEQLVESRSELVDSLGPDSAVVTELSRISDDLHHKVMQIRMQPIGNIWNRLPRVVRDLAQASGKEVRVEMEGASTELDRAIIEAIKDPLTHLVRNSVDHGIEDPVVRRAANKASEGHLSLRAVHEGGLVVIELTDDGAGIDTHRLGTKAVEAQLLTSRQVDAMSEADLVGLMFLPGLSTAREVTNVSGRGVGMDVVRTNIEQVGGRIDVETQIGVGTTFRITIPVPNAAQDQSTDVDVDESRQG